MSLIRKLSMIGVLLLTLTACQKQVPLDPRDADLEEEMSRISREVYFHITSDFWGPVKVSIVVGSLPSRLALVNTTTTPRTYKVQRSRFGSGGRIGILLTPLGSTQGVLIRDFRLGSSTKDVWLQIRSKLATSSVSWR